MKKEFNWICLHFYSVTVDRYSHTCSFSRKNFKMAQNDNFVWQWNKNKLSLNFSKEEKWMLTWRIYYKIHYSINYKANHEKQKNKTKQQDQGAHQHHVFFFPDSQIPTPLDKLEALWISDHNSVLWSRGCHSSLHPPCYWFSLRQYRESSAGHSFTV